MYKKIPRFICILIILMLSCIILTQCMGRNAPTVKEAVADPNSKPEEYLKVEMIQKDNIMNTIKALSSENYKGRLAGSEENYRATKYVATYFEKIGLENPKKLFNCIQAYIQPIVQLSDKPVMQIIDKKGNLVSDFDYREDFVLRRLSSETNAIDLKTSMYLVQDPNVLAKNNGSLKGKILLIPWKFYDILGSQDEPIDLAKTCGAAGVISEFDLEKNASGYCYLKVTPLAGSWLRSDSYSPFAFVDSDTFAKLTKAANAGNKLHFSCNSNVNINSIAFNVIGLIPGCDPSLKNDYIIISAHFDHVGGNMDGTFNPGALDNATGVSSMMELARVIKDSKIQPKKSILFIAFNGEESGNYGSSYYAEHPVFPLEKSVMITLDMIGSSGIEPLTIATASADSDTSLRDALAEYADNLKISYVKNTESAGDHVVFDRVGVPSVCLSNLEFKSGYHSPQDTIEVVDADKVAKITELMMNYILENAY